MSFRKSETIFTGTSGANSFPPSCCLKVSPLFCGHTAYQNWFRKSSSTASRYALRFLCIAVWLFPGLFFVIFCKFLLGSLTGSTRNTLIMFRSWVVSLRPIVSLMKRSFLGWYAVPRCTSCLACSNIEIALSISLSNF